VTEPPDYPGLTWRPLSLDLLDAWHGLYEAARVADDGHEHLTTEELADELDCSWIDLEADTTLGLDEDGVARAFGLVQVRPGDVTMLRAHCWGTVHPQWRGRGAGRSLIAWQEGVARRIVAERRAGLAAQSATGKDVPAQAWLGVDECVQDAAQLAERSGFALTRWYCVMRRDLAVPGPDVPDVLPGGLRLVRSDSEHARALPDLDERIRTAHNDAFQDHWGFQPWSAETWAQWESGYRWHRPDWTFAVLDGDDVVVAYATGAGYETDWTEQGYSEGWTTKVGVRRAWRGHGLAKRLLGAQIAAFRQAGTAYAGLDVDSQNPSGAVRLYEGLGYSVLRRTQSWSKPL
jgi:ribosomal protein S18 acetylase RimI-like enzyme